MFSTIAASSDEASSRRSTIAGSTGEPGALRRAPAALAGDQLVAAALARAHEDRLQHAVLGQRRGQRVERRLVEAPARLRRVRLDELDRDVAQLRAIAVLSGYLQDRGEAASHAAFSHVRPPPWPGRSTRPLRRSAGRDG